MKKPDKKELLEHINEKINIIFEGKFTDADRVIEEILCGRLITRSRKLAKFARQKDPEMFNQSLFPDEFDKAARECRTGQADSCTRLVENKEFCREVMERMARGLYMSTRSGGWGNAGKASLPNNRFSNPPSVKGKIIWKKSRRQF